MWGTFAMSDWIDLSYKSREFLVREAVDALLKEMATAWPTVLMADQVALRVSTAARPVKGKEVYGLLVDIARKGHPQAVQDGEVFYRYGKKMRRWNWYPVEKPEFDW